MFYSEFFYAGRDFETISPRKPSKMAGAGSR
jgi:hypothetical protein